MYLAKELTQASLPEIGRAFSGKHHTNSLHSIQKIDQLRARDPDLNSLIHKLIDTISLGLQMLSTERISMCLWIIVEDVRRA